VLIEYAPPPWTTQRAVHGGQGCVSVARGRCGIKETPDSPNRVRREIQEDFGRWPARRPHAAEDLGRQRFEGQAEAEGVEEREQRPPGRPVTKQVVKVVFDATAERDGRHTVLSGLSDDSIQSLVVRAVLLDE
jgi:hypothetical protein